MRKTKAPLQLIIAATATVLLMTALPGCTSSTPTRVDDPDEFIGSPPENDDDALFRHALPAEAVPADPSGRVGRSGAPVVEEPAVVEEPDVVEEREVIEEPTVASVERPVEEFEPPEDLVPARRACFSCVRICPVTDDGRLACDEGADDLICGWGSHDEESEASRAAQAHCEASLDMARHMPNYSEIEGQCPRPTCQ